MPEKCLWFGSRGPFWWERGGLCRCRWSQKLTRYIVVRPGGSLDLPGVCADAHTRPREALLGRAGRLGKSEKIGHKKGHISALGPPMRVIFLSACRESDSCQNDVWVEGAKPHPPPWYREQIFFRE